MDSNWNKIYRLIKKYPNIIIGRHTGADPDALASQIALKEIILMNFPKKKVYAVGSPASRFKFLGSLDKLPEEAYQNSLAIIVDNPDLKRLDGIDMTKVTTSIKIDHHPFIEKFCDLEVIDETSTSASQMILELVEHTKLKMNKSQFEKLYIGLVSDSNRFLYSYTSPRTFELVSKYISKFSINVAELYDPLYLKPIAEIRFQGYLEQSLKITENGLGYIFVDKDIISKYKVDSASAGNMINNINHIEEALVIVTMSEDVKNQNIRVSIRSRGPVINKIAEEYKGGGHIFAAGARLDSKEQIGELIQKLDEVCANYEV